ncbi:MAG: hypothetical protein ACOCZK_03570 [Planctomycetota bacterium]
MRTPLVCALLCIAATGVAETRFHQYTAQFKQVDDPATPVTLSYLGGESNEWLAGGGFQGDGSIVVAGTAVGPTFALASGTSVRVLGADGPPPPGDVEVSRKDRKGRDAIVIDYEYTDGAPFVVKLSPDGGSVLTAVRLPWGSGSCTSAVVDASGALYIAGVCGPNVDALGASPVADPDYLDEDARNVRCFVARLDPALGSVVWAKTYYDERYAPYLRVTKKGDIAATGGHLAIFAPDGAMREYVKLWLVKNWCRGVNPVDNSFALGYDRNTGTGREPWRKPYLQIHNADHSMRSMLYAWDSHYVGIPSLRLVSDSSFRKLFYDDEGMLYLVGWSDGGNSVLGKQPFDIRRSHGHDGLGWSLWGANALSACWLIKLDPESGQVKGATTYMAYLGSQNKPSSLSVKHIGFATDDSIVLTGGSAFGFIQTGQSKFTGDYVGGSFISIMPPDMGDLRFAAVVPGTGKVRLANKERNWSIAAAKVGGRHKVLVVSGAVEDGEQWFENPAQQGFGGGTLDGHLAVFDCGPVGSAGE